MEEWFVQQKMYNLTLLRELIFMEDWSVQQKMYNLTFKGIEIYSGLVCIAKELKFIGYFSST